MSDTETAYPRIYVASLSDYNAGRLHGIWIDVDDVSGDDIGQQVEDMLAQSSEPIAEEWAIHDYEGFGSIRLSEWESFERVAELGRMIAEHGEAFKAWIANDPTKDEDDFEDFEDEYRGTWESVEDYAYELIQDLVPRSDLEDSLLGRYFDYEAFARDLVLGGDIWTADLGYGEVAIFSGC